jgi:hypothetical protein
VGVPVTPPVVIPPEVVPVTPPVVVPVTPPVVVPVTPPVTPPVVVPVTPPVVNPPVVNPPTTIANPTGASTTLTTDQNKNIASFVTANIKDPATVTKAALNNGVTAQQIATATGVSLDDVVNYLVNGAQALAHGATLGAVSNDPNFTAEHPTAASILNALGLAGLIAGTAGAGAALGLSAETLAATTGFLGLGGAGLASAGNTDTTGSGGKGVTGRVDVGPITDEDSGKVLSYARATTLTPQATIDGIKSAAGAGISNQTIASTFGVSPDAVNTILNPSADSYTGFYDKTFGNTTKQDFSTDLKNAFDYKVGINNNYQPVSTENSPLANIALGLANGYLGAADYIVAGVKSLLGSQTFAQELAHGKTEATNFKAESPISSLASTLTGQLAGAAVGGPSGAKSVVDLGKTVYDFLTGGYTATPSSLASERALGNKIDSTGYLQIDPETQASIDAVSRMTNPVTDASYGDYNSNPTIWDSIVNTAGTIWDDITGGIFSDGGSTATSTDQPPLTNTEIDNNFWANGAESSFNAEYDCSDTCG